MGEAGVEDPERAGEGRSDAGDQPRDAGVTEAQEEEESRTLKGELMVFFSETSAHGFRFQTMARATLCRKLLWAFVLIGAFAFFFYLFVEDVKKYLENKKVSNEEHVIPDTVPFPAVTICNQQKYKLTKLLDKSLFEVLLDDNLHNLGYGIEENSDGEKDKYLFQGVQCGLDIVNDDLHVTLVNVSRLDCRKLCSTLYSDFCAGFYYEGNDSMCYIGPYSSRTDNSGTTHCTRNIYEFQRRLRYLDHGRVSCATDGDEDCSSVQYDEFTKNGTLFMSWESVNVEDTSNISKPRAQYLQMKNDGYPCPAAVVGRIKTVYVNTTGRCLRFQYNGYVLDPEKTESSIKVVIYDETGSMLDTHEAPYWNAEGLESELGQNWYKFSQILPPGVHQIQLEGNASETGTVITVYNFVIDECDTNETTPEECYRHRHGLDYIGTKNVSASGKPCLRWDQHEIVSSKLYPHSENYCRAVLGDLGAPSCQVRSDTGQIILERCDVEFCPCSGEEFRCSNNYCIESSKQCNGHPDCDTEEDELGQCPRSLVCDFSDEYKCGYITDGAATWRIAPGPASVPQRPPAPDTFAFVDHETMKGGKRAFLTFKGHHQSSRAQLTFRFFTTRANLTVRLSLGEPEDYANVTYDVTETSQSGWSKGSVCLPTGTLSLRFVADPHREDDRAAVAVADVRLDPSQCNSPQLGGCSANNLPSITDISCDFTKKTLCGYTNDSDSTNTSIILSKDGASMVGYKGGAGLSGSTTVWVQSPCVEVPARKHYCLSITVRVKGDFGVNITWADRRTIINKRLLYLGAATSSHRSNLDIDIPGVGVPRKVKVRMSMQVISEIKTLSRIYVIKVTEGECLDKVKAEPEITELNCTFYDTYCGFVATSNNQASWILRNEAFMYNFFYMELNLGKTNAAANYLTSPPVRTSAGGSCLKTSYLAIGGLFSVYINLLWGNNSQLFHSKLDNEQTTHEVDLPVGRYHIQYTVGKLFPVERNVYFYLSQVLLFPGSCSGAEARNLSPLPNIKVGQAHQVGPTHTSHTDPPENRDIVQYLLSTYGSISLEEIYQRVGTTLDNSLISCEYNGGSCKGNMRSVDTDLGHCLQFNGDPKKKLSTNVTGTNSGLTVTLNAETYEGYSGNQLSSGMQVIVHTPGDVPQADMAIAIEPGTKTRGFLSLTKGTNLKPPDGDCSEEKVDLYPGDEYTVARCLRSCQTKQMVESCGCKAAYMKGNANVCTYEQYFKCSERISSCDCKKGCSYSENTVEVYDNALVVMNKSKLLPPEEAARIRIHRAEGLDRRDRLDPVKFSIMVASLSELVRMQSLVLSKVSCLERIFSDAAENVENNMEAFKDSVLDYDLADGPGYPFENLPKIISQHDTILKSNLERFDHWLKEIMSGLIEISSGPNNQSIRNVNILRYYGDSLVKVMDDTYELHLTYEFIPRLLMPNDTNLQTCNDTFNKIVKTLTENNAGLQSNSALRDETRSQIQTLTSNRCFRAYSELVSRLKEFDDKERNFFLPERHINISQDMSDAMQQEESIMKNFAYLHDNYTLDMKSRVETLNDAGNISLDIKSASQYEDLLREIGIASRSIDGTIQQYLIADIYGLYDTLFTLVLDMQKYFPEIDYESSIRGLKLWLGPIGSKDISVNISYTMTRSQMLREWPRNKTLDSFRTEAVKIVNERLKNVANPDVFTKLNDVTREISALKSNIEAELAKLTKELDCKKCLDSDEELIRNNFIKLTLNYAEKKITTKEQTKSRDLLELANETGGKMGLLIGMSAITICEFIDFIICYLCPFLTIKKDKRK